MTINQEESTGTSPFTVDFLQPGDAPGLVELFRSVYGDHYPIKLFYDPEAIILANREGRYYSIVARTPSGQIIGVTHLFRSSPFPYLYESGVGLVHKDYRNTGINTHLMSFLFGACMEKMPHIQEVYGEAVCNHPFMQKTARTFSHIETALQVALMPAAAYAKEKSASGRVATLTLFRCYRPSLHRIFLPRVYEDELRWMYSRLDDERDLVLSDGRLPQGTTTRADMEIFDFAGVARIAVPEAGSDLQAR
jgi:GNAT superfamily N-acetyltransferase